MRGNSLSLSLFFRRRRRRGIIVCVSTYLKRERRKKHEHKIEFLRGTDLVNVFRLQFFFTKAMHTIGRWRLQLLLSGKEYFLHLMYSLKFNSWVFCFLPPPPKLRTNSRDQYPIMPTPKKRRRRRLHTFTYLRVPHLKPPQKKKGD